MHYVMTNCTYIEIHILKPETIIQLFMEKFVFFFISMKLMEISL
jgi:hypothetical protein